MRCLSCGKALCQMEPGQAMAIAGRCGAMPPVLFSDTGSLAPPASLILRLASHDPPHLEYYLGYSDHQSEAKDQLIDLLVSHGARRLLATTWSPRTRG